MKADASVPKTWDEWTDCLGNSFRAGDIIAVATINGKSPQLVLARVERINRVNSSGEEIWTNKWFDHEEPIEHERECRIRNSTDAYMARYYADHVCKRECFFYIETGEYRKVSSCTVRAKPIVDARGFSRWGKTADGENKSVTYSIPENMILVEKRSNG